MNDAPQRLLKHLKYEQNEKISEFSSQPSNKCFYYFIKRYCNCIKPLNIEDIDELMNIIICNKFTILYKDTKIVKEVNNNAIMLIQN